MRRLFKIRSHKKILSNYMSVIYFHKPKIEDIKTSIHRLKLAMIKHQDHKLAIPTIAAGLDKCNWSIIKQLIYSEFHNSNINLLICYKNNTEISNNWKTKEHNDLLNITRTFKQIPIQNKKLNNLISRDNAYTIFSNYKKGENVLGDDILNLTRLPNYYWSDDELASIANYYNHNTYIYDDTNKTGIIYCNNNNSTRPSIVLYNVNNNTHWIPGTKSTQKSHKIPIKYITTNNFISLKNIINKINIFVNNNLKTPITVNDTDCHKNNLFNGDNINYRVNKQTKTLKNDFINNKNILTNNDKETITDCEGTPIKISPNLNSNQHKQVIKLLKTYINLFTSDTSNRLILKWYINVCVFPNKMYFFMITHNIFKHNFI
ncbi:Uncharacterized protein FWK35_00024469 [Aphis craccivora]|uniref:Uncharacterized protein n=1 Tax=Aphis craccivora TaxID=307492 RepID=A0A6G0XEC7_APHCR|nr:Uncharacterized protein FWK35_00024469 [Aphis craccivora]